MRLYFQEFSKNQSFTNYPSSLFATAIHEHHIPDVRDATATEEDYVDKFIASAYDFWLKKAPQILDLVDLAIVFFCYGHYKNSD